MKTSFAERAGRLSGRQKAATAPIFAARSRRLELAFHHLGRRDVSPIAGKR